MNVSGEVRVPGDKSISHRALLLSALAFGRSRVRGLLDAADIRSTSGVLRTLGVALPDLADDVVIDGAGRAALRQPHQSLDCGNSGTTTRLVAGIVAASPITARFVGDGSLSRRPMRRVARPLEAMGARVAFERDDGLPMSVSGGRLRGVQWSNETASAQIKSAILLAGLVADVPVTIVEPRPSRDHTERMLAARGADVVLGDGRVTLQPGKPLGPCDVYVPGDPSSAAFFVALATLATSGELFLPRVGINPTRTGFFDVLASMGATIAYHSTRDEGGEPIADLVVRPSALRGTTIDHDRVPALIDELPLLACVATRAAGVTTIRGASELRVKESDRIATVVSNLQRLGARATELPDGLIVEGADRPLVGRVVTHGDHRLAMSFGVLAALPANRIEIDDPSCVDVSFPTFWQELSRAAGRRDVVATRRLTHG